MAMVTITCPECKKDIEIELAKKKSVIIKTCPECNKEICCDDGSCITVAECP